MKEQWDHYSVEQQQKQRFSVLNLSLCSRSSPGTISCPICMDSYSEVRLVHKLFIPIWHLEMSTDWLWFPLQIIESGRLVVSTKCGHVFCSQCLRDALASSHTCPTCRKRLTCRQYHPLYVWPPVSSMTVFASDPFLSEEHGTFSQSWLVIDGGNMIAIVLMCLRWNLFLFVCNRKNKVFETKIVK